MENKRIVFKGLDGSVGVIIPALEWFAPDEDGNIKTLEDLAAKDVPAGRPWRIVEVSSLPASRNWRNAWTDENPTETVDVDLVKARKAHKLLMQAKAGERVDLADLPDVLAEIAALPLDAVTTLQDLYNMWPVSIEKRAEAREYRMHEVA